MSDDLNRLVFAAMDAADENGYGHDNRNDSLENVAIDLIDYDYDIGELRPAVMDLIPHIEAWRAARANSQPKT